MNNVKNTVSSAIDIVQAMGLSTCQLLPKVKFRSLLTKLTLVDFLLLNSKVQTATAMVKKTMFMDGEKQTIAHLTVEASLSLILCQNCSRKNMKVARLMYSLPPPSGNYAFQIRNSRLGIYFFRE